MPSFGGPWRLAMGLRPLDLANWLEADANRDGDLAEKARLLDHAPEVVVGVEAGSEAAQAELERLVVAAIASENRPSRVGEGSDEAAIVRAARLVQEDLCCFERREGRWVMTAACVCFPSRWTLRTKVGRDLAAIHAPVPGYDDALAHPVERFFDRLRPDRPMWRLNWTILDTDELHLPTPSARRTLALPEDLSNLTFRVERQTFRALPDSGAICFTIKTTTDRLGDLLDGRADLAHALRSTLESVTDDVAAYKGWTPLLEPLLDWLTARR
jgi:hypothetical protein